MTLENQIFAFLMLCVFVTCILYVAFGQITVRKLRKNPKTKDALGVEYASGWDIINVAQALAFPKSWSKKLHKSPLSFMHANSELIFQNTNKFDHVLGLVFYWLFVFSGFSLIMLMILSELEVFSG